MMNTNKKILAAGAGVLAIVCALTSCTTKGKKNNGEDGATTAKDHLETYAVSQTQYQYLTDANGANVTVAVTDAEGNTHYYLQMVKPGTANPADPTAAAPETIVDESGNIVTVTNPEGEPAGDAPVSYVQVATNDTVSKAIDILNGESFGLYGTMKTDGETVPMAFIKRGKDIRMTAKMQGISLDLAVLGGTKYLISTTKKSYIELTDTVASTLGLDMSDLNLDFSAAKGDGGQMVEDAAQYNGKQVQVFTSAGSDNIMKFYVDGDKVVKIEFYDMNGVCSTLIETDEIRGDITAADIEIPADYEKKSYLSFIADIMGDIES